MKRSTCLYCVPPSFDSSRNTRGIANSYAFALKDWGHIFLPVSVCLSICPLSPIAQSVALRTWEQEVAWPIFFPRIDDSHCDRIYSSLTTVCCFDNGYVGKQPVVWKEYCVEYWLKKLLETMDRCTGHRDITKILSKIVLNTMQSINQLSVCPKLNVKNNISLLLQNYPSHKTHVRYESTCHWCPSNEGHLSKVKFLTLRLTT